MRIRSPAPIFYLAIGLVTLSLTSLAGAEEHEDGVERERMDPAAEKTDGKLTWYGWQIALSDAAAAGLLAWGVAANADAPFGCGLAIYLFIPPAIHRAHDRDGALLGSLALRLVVPAFASVSGWEQSGEADEGAESDDRLSTPVFASMAAGALIDIAFLSLQVERRPRRSALRPRVWLHRHKAALGAGGVF